MVKTDSRYRETIQGLAEREVANVPPTDEDASNLLKSLHTTGLFSDIEIKREENSLRVTSVDEDIIRNLKVSGGKEIHDKELQRDLKIPPNSPHDKFKLADLTKRIVSYYETLGFIDVVVEQITTEVCPGVIDLELKIEKNKKPKISNVRFIGNRQIKSSILRDSLFFGESRGLFLDIFTGRNKFAQEVSTLNPKLLEDFYHDRGFLDMSLVNAQAEFDKNTSSVKLVYEISEGEQYMLEAQNFSDLDCQDDEIRTEIEKILSLNDIGKPINKSKLDANLAKARDVLNGSCDNLDLVMDTQKDPNHCLTIKYSTKTIEPVVINRINITGNTKTKDRVIRERITLHEGDVLNPAKLKSSYRSIVNLNYFDNVLINYKPVNDSKVDLDVELLEKKTGEIDFSGGYSSINKLFARIHYTERNLLGTGNGCDVSLERSKKSLSFSSAFSKTNFLDTGLSVGFGIFYERDRDILYKPEQAVEQKKPSEYFRYRTTEKGFALSTRAPLKEDLSLTLKYQLKSSEVMDVENASPEFIREQIGRRMSSSVRYKFDYDKRDFLEYPRNGYLAVFEQEVAGLFADKYYLLTEASGEFYKPILSQISPKSGTSSSRDSDIILQLRARAGYIFPFNGYKLLITDKFFLRDTRGFQPLYGITPHNKSGDPIGGNKYVSGSVQIEYPINFLKDFSLKHHFFLDCAVLTDKKFGGLFDSSSDSDNKLRFSVGTGFVVNIPKLFPVYVDFALPLSHNSKDFLKKWSFNVGRRI